MLGLPELIVSLYVTFVLGIIVGWFWGYHDRIDEEHEVDGKSRRISSGSRTSYNYSDGKNSGEDLSCSSKMPSIIVFKEMKNL